MTSCKSLGCIYQATMGRRSWIMIKECYPLATLDALPVCSINDETNHHALIHKFPDKVGGHGAQERTGRTGAINTNGSHPNATGSFA